MINQVKVIFKKKKNGMTHTSDGYYVSEEDFKSRNGTLFFVSLTTKTKPPVVKREK